MPFPTFSMAKKSFQSNYLALNCVYLWNSGFNGNLCLLIARHCAALAVLPCDYFTHPVNTSARITRSNMNVDCDEVDSLRD